MGTSFDDIIDLALISIKDYKLDKLYNLSKDAFIKYCDGFLIQAIPNFTQCKQSLDYDINNREFLNELTILEKNILADFWVIEWFKKETQDSAQLANKLQVSSAFTMHSPAQNLKEKSEYLDRLREKVYQKITDYWLSDFYFLKEVYNE